MIWFWGNPLLALYLYNAADPGAVIRKVLFKVEKTLIVFRIEVLKLFIEKTPQRGLLVVRLNDTVAQLAVYNEGDGIIRHIRFSRALRGALLC